MTRDKPISLWAASAQEPDVAAPLSGADTVDVAIVGGGFTGLSTALHCAEAGLSAHVLEAEQLGHGGSGRNVGLVNAGVWHPPAAVRTALGPTYGPRFTERFGAAPEYVFSLIERHQIRCEVTRTGTIHAAHAPSGQAELKARHAEWQRLGAPVDLLDRAEVAAATGTEVFHGGLLDHRAGTINPMGYCRGLARAARGAGATISTGTRVTSLRRDGGAWIVGTESGDLRARAVVLGTNAYSDDLWPGLKRAYTTINFFQLATEPLGPAAKDILPGRQGLWSTGKIMVSLRRDMSDRLILGSMGRIMGTAAGGASHRWAQKKLAAMFPALGPVTFEEAWTGQIAMTPDHLPRICKLGENLYTPVGYNGRGITTGTLFGQAMAGLLTGMDLAELPLPMTDLAPVRSAPIMSRLYQMAFAANQVIKSI
ncbi:NAD(P)/FAD-dependent oxidoreductase [Roseisalinus antarcticus]|uniref:Gamma-glutamylputrescine oxidoreductase n=1 Tax=Roseisalinus antarcticus TaxID=254357 RepID=A0A1Y5T4T4_9RHOB|nr:FAD-binding oxidoreductase [Roseisalinus antarcticus]SLN52346.1 Gamma-glutamylputrescine oxidoreductase [Roseisalinus antarcticus]